MSSPEDEIRQQRAAWKEAFESGDVDRIMSFYAPGAQTVAFDILPPLRFNGWDAYRADWIKFLALFDGPIKVGVQESSIIASAEVGLVHALIHLTSTMSGRPFELWMRGTNGLRKIDGKWLVVHDHVSVPVDITTGKSAMDLQP